MHQWTVIIASGNRSLTGYVKLQVVHAPGMPETFSPPPRLSDPDLHHGTCAVHVPWCMPGSLTSDYLWNLWRGKGSPHSRRMRNPQMYVSGKRSMACCLFVPKLHLNQYWIIVNWTIRNIFLPMFFFIIILHIIERCRLQNCDHFVQSPTCYEYPVLCNSAPL